ncbi:MAG: tetratricopeptide repeat protein [Vicinamibacteria bacterium]|nr:tetratricopeptide repeat protein [Vicinamibacteria bacterium]MBP9945338.1 tetratricopeptide repeat protein [Vicinamibacteria bacterium]
MAAEFSWTPPLVVLALGAVAGAVAVGLRSRQKHVAGPVEPSPASSQSSDLQQRYDALIRRLAEGVSDDEKARIELEAAHVLMEMESPGRKAKKPDSSKAEVAPEAPAPAKVAARPPSALAGFAYGVLAMGTLGGLFYLASLGSTERAEGGSPTGGNTMGSAAAARPENTAAENAEIAALEANVQKTPQDIGQRVELTRAYLRQRDLMKVFDQTQAILQIQPGEPHALTYQALVRVAMGQADQAETMLVDAIKKNPRIEDAYIHLAIARLQLGNKKGAEAAIGDGQKQFPEDRELLADVFKQISSAAETEAAAGPPAAGAPASAPPEADSAVPAAAGSGSSVVVVVNLPQGVTVPSGAILFVMAREAGFDTGAPVAVKRVPAMNFPITVTLSEKDSMAGESLPGLMRIDARIDPDGDPMTKNPTDPVGSEDNVRPGAGQVLLVLTPGKK